MTCQGPHSQEAAESPRDITQKLPGIQWVLNKHQFPSSTYQRKAEWKTERDTPGGTSLCAKLLVRFQIPSRTLQTVLGSGRSQEPKFRNWQLKWISYQDVSWFLRIPLPPKNAIWGSWLQFKFSREGPKGPALLRGLHLVGAYTDNGFSTVKDSAVI